MYYIPNPKKGIQRRFESQKEKKIKEKNLNPPEGFCITFRIPKGNSKKAWKPKRKEKKWEKFKSTWRILYYIQNSEREFKEGLKAKKRKEKKWEEFKSTWRVLYYIQNPKRDSKKAWKPKRKEKKWEEFKSTWRILYYIQNPKSEFKEGLKARKEKKREEFKSTWRILYYIQNSEREFKEGLKAKKRKEKKNEKNLNSPEGFCITFRIPKGNSKKVWKPKKERKKKMSRI